MDTSEHMIETNLRRLKVEIAQMIRGPSVVQHLYGLLASAEIKDIVSMYQKSDSKATYRMIECLLDIKRPGKWETLVMALEQAEYSYVVSLLKGDRDNCQRHAKRILQVFAPYLECQIDPHNLVDALRAGEAISDLDVQEILACQDNKGPMAAAAILLDRLQCRLAPSDWYLQFLRTLYKKGYQTLVKDMEPEFTEDCEVLKCPDVTEISVSRDDYTDNTNKIEEIIQRNMSALKEEVAENIEIDQVLPHIQSTLLNNDALSHISDISKNRPVRAAMTMLDEIGRLQSNCKWRMFVDCLEKAEYPALVEKLKSETPQRHAPSTEKWIIAIFNAILQYNINPSEVVPHLVSEGVINDADKIEILETNRQHGNVRACGILIQRLHSRRNTWYTVFLETLMNCQYESVVEIVDPDFHKKYGLRNLPSSSSLEYGTNDMNEELKFINKRISVARTSLNNKIETLENEIRSYSTTLAEMEKESLGELQTIKLRLMSPIDRASYILKQYMAGKTTQRIQEIDIEIEKELIISESTTIAVAHNLMLDRTKKLVNLYTTEGRNTETVRQSKPHLHVERFRKYSDESCSSHSSGYIKVAGEIDSTLQTSTSDEFSEKDTYSCFSSNSSTRNSSPVSLNTRVSFKKPLDDLQLQSRETVVKYRHMRSKSSVELSCIARTYGARRQRTQSESSIKEENGDDEMRKSSSSGEMKWYQKGDVRLEGAVIKPHQNTKARTTTNRKRSTSESELSVVTKSTTTSPEYPSDYLSSQGQVNELSSMISSDNDRFMVLHEKHCIRSGQCFLTDICAIGPSGSTAVVDHNGGHILLFDADTKQFRCIMSCSGIYKPYKIVCQERDILSILFKSPSCSSKLRLYTVKRGENKKCRNRISGLHLACNIQLSCADCVTDIKGLNDQVVAICFNKHVHFIRGNQETRVLNLCVDLHEWWPNSTAIEVHLHTKHIYVYDLYSQKLYCFDTETGELKWDLPFPKEKGIEGIALFGSKIYLAQNHKDKIVVLNNTSHKPSSQKVCWEDDVKYPFVLQSTKTGLLMTQFRQGQHKVNRTVTFF